MTKHVYDGRQLAHIWAQQTQASGHNNNNQFYFDGPAIYSYGRHFPIASFHTARNGARYVLFTTREYSMTTSKHKTYTRYAIPAGVPLFMAQNPLTPSAYKSDAESQIATLKGKAATARQQKHALNYIGEAIAIAARANEFATMTGERWRIKEPVASADYIAKAKAAKERADKQAAIRATKAREKFIAEQARKIAAWYSGELESLRFDSVHGGAALRIVGDELQTSHGARVPLAHAIRAFRFLKLCREHGRAWQHNGHRLNVGHFTVDRIDADGSFRAGCHDIRWPEVERVARLAGVFDDSATDEALTPSTAAA